MGKVRDESLDAKLYAFSFSPIVLSSKKKVMVDCDSIYVFDYGSLFLFYLWYVSLYWCLVDYINSFWNREMWGWSSPRVIWRKWGKWSESIRYGYSNYNSESIVSVSAIQTWVKLLLSSCRFLFWTEYSPVCD